MELGPHADCVMELVELVESGTIFRNPRPHLAPGIKRIDEVAKIFDYKMIMIDQENRSALEFPDGSYWEWRELLDGGGDLDNRIELNIKHMDFLDSIPGLTDNLVILMEQRVAPALDLHLGSKYEENCLSFIYGNLDFILSFRASFGRSMPFLERLVEIYRLGGHPCGWVGPYPEGRLVAYFPPADDSR